MSARAPECSLSDKRVHFADKCAQIVDELRG
jgi:hypothetical protein